MRKHTVLVAIASASLALSAALAYAAAPKNLERAISAQQKLIAQRPADSGLENDLGSLLVLGGDFAGAEAAYRRALAIDGENAAAHYNLGLLLQKQGERRKALAEYKRVVEIAPRHAWAHYQMGTIYDAQGRDSAARKAYAKALAYDPSLGNPEVNPHLIENELATSAMLYSYHHYREELLPEREFEEPARIARVLIDRPTADTAVAATSPTAEAGGFVRGSGEAPNASSGGEETAAVDDSVKVEPPPDGDAAESRVLTSKDLDPSRTSGQIVGVAPSGRGNTSNRGNRGEPITSTTNRGRIRDTQQPLRPTLRSPQSQPPQVLQPTPFVPTGDSTGMIETELVEIDEWS